MEQMSSEASVDLGSQRFPRDNVMAAYLPLGHGADVNARVDREHSWLELYAENGHGNI